MPLKNIFLDDTFGILRVGEGIVTANEILDANNEILSKEKLRPNLLYIIVDMTKANDLEASSSDMQQIAASDSRMLSASSNVVIAICATADLVYGLARMWEAYANTYDFYHSVKRSRSEAENWLLSKVKEVHGIDITRPSSRRT